MTNVVEEAWIWVDVSAADIAVRLSRFADAPIPRGGIGSPFVFTSSLELAGRETGEVAEVASQDFRRYRVRRVCCGFPLDGLPSVRVCGGLRVVIRRESDLQLCLCREPFFVLRQPVPHPLHQVDSRPSQRDLQSPASYGAELRPSLSGRCSARCQSL